jgi:hypothetical protein
MIRFVPKDRVEEGNAGNKKKKKDLEAASSVSHGEQGKFPGEGRTAARARGRISGPAARFLPRERASTELERIGVSILEGLEYLLERNKQNKDKKAAWEEEEGKKAWAAKVGQTSREKEAAKKGGKGGGPAAQQAGTRASYRASARQARQDSTKVDAFTKAQAERRASHKPMLQRVAGATAALKDAKKDRPKLP